MGKISGLSLLLVILLGGCQCGNQKTEKPKPALIDIHITNGNIAKITVEKVTTDNISALETVVTDKNGKAFVRLFPEEEEIILLRFENNDFIPVIIEAGGSYKVMAEYSDIPASFEVKGGDESKALTVYFQRLYRDMSQSDSLAQLMLDYKTTPQFSEMRDKAVANYQVIYEAHKQFADSIITVHPGYLSTLLILNQSLGQKRIYELHRDTAIYFLADHTLTERIPGNSHVMAFHKKITEYKQELAAQRLAEERLSVGHEAPGFVIPNESGELINLSDFKGKIVLLAFWNSKEQGTPNNLPMLKTMYNDYKKYGFEIIAISMDTNDQTWKNNLKHQGTSWINVSDLKGTTSPLVKLYNLSEKLPVYYLIGRDGNILAQHPSMMELDDILFSEIVEKKEHPLI